LEGSGESQEIPTISHIAVGSGQGKDELGDNELQFIDVSPAQLELVKNLRFTMLTPNYVATGLQPFQFPEEALDGSINAQALYEALYAGMSAPPMADLATVMQ
jgi:hypothetical protein